MSNVERRTKVLKVRLSEAEHAALVERSTRPQLAEWVRETCLGAAPPRRRRVPPTVDPALLRQHISVGNLLNQIARKVNGGEWGPADRVQVVARLAAIERELLAIRAEHEIDGS